MFKFKALIKMIYLSFLFQQKRNPKIGAREDLALTLLYSIKKINPSLLSRYWEILARVNGMVEKIDFEKNEKQSFLMQYVS